jgi:hypothetical protein
MTSSPAGDHDQGAPASEHSRDRGIDWIHFTGSFFLVASREARQR